MGMRKIEKALLEVLDAIGGGLPAEQVEDMRDLVRHCEPGVAFENLCEQLNEYDVPVPREVYERLVWIGKAMKIDPSYWEGLGEGSQ